MVTLQELKAKIENANALGIANLGRKGVEVPESATTYEIMQSIAEIVSDGSEYTTIVFNGDNTITLTDTDGVIHTMVCEYDNNGKLSALTYDATEISLTYEGDSLIEIGGTEFHSINTNCLDEVYKYFGVDKTVYPYLTIGVKPDSNNQQNSIAVGFTKEKPVSTTVLYTALDLGGERLYGYIAPDSLPDAVNFDTVFELIVNSGLILEEYATGIAANRLGYASVTPSYVYFFLNYESDIVIDDEEVYEEVETNSLTPEKMNFQNGFALGLASGGVNIVKDTEFYDAFWDVYQAYGNRTDYSYAFANVGWTDESYKPRYTIKPSGADTTYMYFKSLVTEIGEKLDLSNVTQLANTFRNSKCNKMLLNNISEGCKFTTAFVGCNLTDLAIAGVIGQSGFDIHWSIKLNKESHISVIEALSPTTEELSITLSLAAVNSAFETSEGALDGSTSEEWLNLIATKANWTIALQ